MRRDQSQVKNITDFYMFLSYNDYENDPFSDKKPEQSMCARRDLRKDMPIRAFGCIDIKATSFKLAEMLEAYVISGPTKVKQPVFEWTS